MLYNYGEFDHAIKKKRKNYHAAVFDVTGSGDYNGSYPEKEE